MFRKCNKALSECNYHPPFSLRLGVSRRANFLICLAAPLSCPISCPARTPTHPSLLVCVCAMPVTTFAQHGTARSRSIGKCKAKGGVCVQSRYNRDRELRAAYSHDDTQSAHLCLWYHLYLASSELRMRRACMRCRDSLLLRPYGERKCQECAGQTGYCV